MARASRATAVLALLAATCLPAGALHAQAKAKAPPKPAVKKASPKDLALEKELLKATRKVETAHAKELEKIVTWAATNGLKAEAGKTVEKIAALDEEYSGLEKLRAKAAKAAPVDEGKAEDLRKTFAKKVEDANEKNAARLFDFATKCMRVGLFTRAYDLVNAVIEADPDHKRARDILSYAWDPGAKTWISKWEASMKKDHFLTPEGWVPKKEKARWDKGLREYQGKWVPREEEERIRKRNEYNAASASTEHFEVRTNLGREKAFEFALLLEDFYRQFFRVYIGFYDQVAGAKLLFNQAKLKKKHQVLLFPSRARYEQFVRAEKGNDELLLESGGFYESGSRMSYFYWTDDLSGVLHTLYHEVTHQLFAETKERGGGSQGNNWIVEGIASYMESWVKVGGKWHPGANLGSNRLQTAKAFLSANPGWSLASYARIGHDEFHRENRGLNYCLGAALSHFFMHHQDGIYKEDFVQLISAYYGGQLAEDSLGQYIAVEGASTPEEVVATLEKQFKEYMKDLGSIPVEAASTGDAGQ